MDSITSTLILTTELETPTTHELQLAVEFAGREYGRLAEKESKAWAEWDRLCEEHADRDEIEQAFLFASILTDARMDGWTEWQATKARLLGRMN